MDELTKNEIEIIKDCCVLLPKELCRICNTSFKCKLDLKQHIEEEHPDMCKPVAQIILKIGQEVVSKINVDKKFLKNTSNYKFINHPPEYKVSNRNIPVEIKNGVEKECPIPPRNKLAEVKLDQIPELNEILTSLIRQNEELLEWKARMEKETENTTNEILSKQHNYIHKTSSEADSTVSVSSTGEDESDEIEICIDNEDTDACFVQHNSPASEKNNISPIVVKIVEDDEVQEVLRIKRNVLKVADATINHESPSRKERERLACTTKIEDDIIIVDDGIVQVCSSPRLHQVSQVSTMSKQENVKYNSKYVIHLDDEYLRDSFLSSEKFQKKQSNWHCNDLKVTSNSTLTKRQSDISSCDTISDSCFFEHKMKKSKIEYNSLKVEPTLVPIKHEGDRFSPDIAIVDNDCFIDPAFNKTILTPDNMLTIPKIELVSTENNSFNSCPTVPLDSNDDSAKENNIRNSNNENHLSVNARSANKHFTTVMESNLKTKYSESVLILPTPLIKEEIIINDV